MGGAGYLLFAAKNATKISAASYVQNVYAMPSAKSVLSAQITASGAAIAAAIARIIIVKAFILFVS